MSSTVATFLPTPWDNNANSKDNSQLHSNAWCCQGRNIHAHGLGHTVPLILTSQPLVSCSDLALRLSDMEAVSTCV